MARECIKHRMPNGMVMKGPVHGMGQVCLEWGDTGANKKSAGGYLVGPSHEEGGIPVIVDGTEPIEVEGGEFVINKKTVEALGEDFLHKLNSTSTPYHDPSGGFAQGELPLPSNYSGGGRTHKIDPNPIPVPKRTNMQLGGGVCGSGYQEGLNGNCLPIVDVPLNEGYNYQTSCPPGQTFQNGMCVVNITSSNNKNINFKGGGKLTHRNNIKRKKRQTGGRLTSNGIGISTSKTTINKNHSHTTQIDPLTRDGIARGHDHNHTIKDGIINTHCDDLGNCHGHNF